MGWGPQVPIRYKITTIPEKVESYNILWAEAITKGTGRRYEKENENYLKLCIPYKESTVYISLFQKTGTVMFQGQTPVYLCICKDVKTGKKKDISDLITVQCAKKKEQMI